MKRKTPKRTRTNPGKVVHRANRIFHGADKMVNLTTLKRDHVYDEEKLVDLFRFLIADPDCGAMHMMQAVKTALMMCHIKFLPHINNDGFTLEYTHSNKWNPFFK